MAVTEENGSLLDSSQVRESAAPTSGSRRGAPHLAVLPSGSESSVGHSPCVFTRPLEI